VWCRGRRGYRKSRRLATPIRLRATRGIALSTAGRARWGFRARLACSYRQGLRGSALVRPALRALIEGEERQHLTQLAGTDPSLSDIARRRTTSVAVILVGTSGWIDHLRSGQPALAMLQAGHVLGHAWVTGELTMRDQRRTPRSHGAGRDPAPLRLGGGASPSNVALRYVAGLRSLRCTPPRQTAGKAPRSTQDVDVGVVAQLDLVTTGGQPHQ
jgi:hypothetical protein